MKAYLDRFPLVVVGGAAQDYLGEYMAGGVLVVLNLQNKPLAVGNFVGTGMHGGSIFIRGKVEEYQVGAEVGFRPAGTKRNGHTSRKFSRTISGSMKLKERDFKREDFVKLFPKSARPYGNLYSY